MFGFASIAAPFGAALPASYASQIPNRQDGAAERLLRRLPLFALSGLLDGLSQPVLVGYGQVTAHELHRLALERVHDGLDLAV